MNRQAAVVIMAVLLAVSGLLGISATGSAQSGLYNSNVNTPYYVYTGQNFSLYVNNTYGFSNYTVAVYFAGDNLTGFSPTNTYNNYSTSNPDFVIPIRAPLASQELTLIVKTTAQSGSKTYSTSNQYTIQVIPPIYLHAMVTNKNQAPMYNVTVNFYVDGTFVGSNTIKTLGSQQSYLVNYTWLAPYIKHGEHSLTVQVNNSLISINNGGSSVTSHFYYGSPPNYSWIYYVVAAVGVFMVIMVMGAGRRPRVGERTPKWKK